MATAKKPSKKPSKKTAAPPAKKPAKKPSKKPVARPTKPEDVLPEADPKRKARYLGLAKEIEAARKDTLHGFDALYEAVAEVLDHELYLDAGYRSRTTWIEEVIKEPVRTVERNARVAKYATADEEARYGVAKLDSALEYVEAVAGGPTKVRLPVRFDALKIPVVGEDGARQKRSLAEATVKDIEAARKALLAAGDNDGASERRSPAERAVLKALRRFASLASVTVSVRDAKLKLGEVALYALGDLRTALGEIELNEE
jgi:hypothetical protein